MYDIKTLFITSALSLTSLIISGCNDIGDSDNDAPNTPASSSKITASNAKPIAAAAFASVNTVEGLSIGSGTLGTRSGNASSGKFNYSDFVIKQLGIVQGQSQFMGRGILSAGAAMANKALNCQVSIKGDVADGPGLSVGDNLSFSFDSCTYNNTDAMVNGSVGISLTQISDDFSGTPPFELGIETVLTDFKVGAQGVDFISNGDMSMLISTKASGDKTLQLLGTSLSVSYGPTKITNSLALTDYLIDLKDSNTGDYSVSQQGEVKLAIPFVNVQVFFATTTPFTGNHDNGLGNPTAGELHISGEGKSQAWVIAQPDGVNIQIDIDINGDDMVDETVMTTWSELQDFF